MDNLSIFLFAIAGISTLVGAFYLMHSASTSEPMKNYRTGTWTTQVKKPMHPEMVDVKPGEELMGVTFQERPTSCDLEEYQALQARIEELKSQLEDDDEDDDDDGDVPALLKR